MLPGGERVVVKVQRPGAARQIRKDIDVLMQFAEMLEGRLDVGFSPTAVVNEFARSITRELDYVLEARNAERFAKNFADDGPVRIPRIYWRYSTSRVLTMERIDGPTLNSPAIAALPLEERQAAGGGRRRLLVQADPARWVLPRRPASRPTSSTWERGASRSSTSARPASCGARIWRRACASSCTSWTPTSRASSGRCRRLGVEWSPSADEAVTQAIEEGFSRYFGMSSQNVDMASLLHQVFDIVYSLRLRLPSRFLLLDKALLTMEGVVKQLYPDLDIFEMGRQLRRRAQAAAAGPADASPGGPSATRPSTRRCCRTTRSSSTTCSTRCGPESSRSSSGTPGWRTSSIGWTSSPTGWWWPSSRIALGVTSTAVGVFVEGGPHVGGLSVWGVPGLRALALLRRVAHLRHHPLGQALTRQSLGPARRRPRRVCPARYSVRDMKLPASLGTHRVEGQPLLLGGVAAGSPTRSACRWWRPWSWPDAGSPTRARPAGSSTAMPISPTRSCSPTWRGRSRPSRRAIDRGGRVVVHGDYDADGITATALMVLGLRELGARGRVVPAQPVQGRIRAVPHGGRDHRRTRARRCSSPSTAASTTPTRSRLAKERGLEVVVVDHHQPGPVLPDCHLIHEVVGEYPHGDSLRRRAGPQGAARAAHPARGARPPTGCPRSCESCSTWWPSAPSPTWPRSTGENRYYVREGLKLIAIGQRVGPAGAGRGVGLHRLHRFVARWPTGWLRG